MGNRLGAILLPLRTGLAATGMMLALFAGAASAAEPLKIGFGMARTGLPQKSVVRSQ